MKLKIYQIDAFASKPFEGNPAAVVPLEEWLSDEVMQSIAEENNLSDTAFFVPNDTGFHIRWFTPKSEMKLCGHATLATAFVLFDLLGFESNKVNFESLSGVLSVTKENDLLTLDFPSQTPESCPIPESLIKGLGTTPSECLSNEDYVVVLESEEILANVIPDHSSLSQLGLRGVIVTAPSCKYDFVARYFAPNLGIPEDPATGSAYTQLTPYWAARLGKNILKAKQLSARGGELLCELKEDRVLISGTAVQYLEGVIQIKT